MGPFKAPGKDSFQAVFYQSQWKIVGSSFCKLIMDALRDHSKISMLNDTLIPVTPRFPNIKISQNNNQSFTT